MHFNALADCLAKHAPLLGPRRGFRCTPEALSWEGRRERIKRELLRYDCDVLGVCEVDHYDDFFAPTLEPEGYDGAYKRKRSPAKDGVAIFWRRRRLEEALRRSVFLDRHKGPGSQVALLQRLHVPGAVAGQGRNLVVCSTHLRASKGDDIRMQQAAEVVSALSDFARGDPQVILADVNSEAPTGSGSSTVAANTVFEYFQACGYRCAYREVHQSLGGPVQGDSAFPRFTTWAGWASGDFRSVCDHIFVAGGVQVASVLDVPCERRLAETFHERLPNSEYPSDHMSLVADLALT